MPDTITIEDCKKIQQRLRDAEKLAEELLASASSDNSLARATRELLEVHAEIREFLQASIEDDAASSSPDSSEIQRAEIEIEAEAHEMKPDAKDILKALFMWRDVPEERANHD